MYVHIYYYVDICTLISLYTVAQIILKHEFWGPYSGLHAASMYWLKPCAWALNSLGQHWVHKVHIWLIVVISRETWMEVKLLLFFPEMQFWKELAYKSGFSQFPFSVMLGMELKATATSDRQSSTQPGLPFSSRTPILLYWSFYNSNRDKINDKNKW